LVLGHAFLDGLRRAFDEVLGFLEAEARDRADLLDDLDLLVAGCRENDGELRLLFRGSAAAGTGRRRNGHRGRRRNAPLLFELLREFRRLEDGQARKLFYNLCKISHFSLPLVRTVTGTVTRLRSWRRKPRTPAQASQPA